MRYRLRGVLLPGGEPTEIFVRDGVVGPESDPGAETIVDGGWIMPGLVDAHCHVGLGPDGAVDLEQAADQATADRDAGVGLIRDCGSPLDTRALQHRHDLPELIRAGRHIARPKRYIRDVSVDVEDPSRLPTEVRRQAAGADGWVKLVGDWIDRDVGDLAPLWDDGTAAAAIAAAHDAGARVTAHVFGTTALPGLIEAGIDCIEHGTGLTPDLVSAMAEGGTALVPTLINVETFPGIAASATRYPAYAEHMRRLHRGAAATVRDAHEAGVAVYAGTDAGGGIFHGRIADEIIALAAAGLPNEAALAAGSWAARSWLGRPGLDPGAPATLVVYPADPRADLAVLHHPTLVMLAGRPFRP